MQNHFSICDTVSTAWHKVKGSKSSIWSAFAIIALIAFAFGFFATLLSFLSINLFQQITAVGMIVNFLLQMGLVYMGIQRARDLPISYNMVWHSFKFKLIIQLFLLFLLFFILFLPPILLNIAATHFGWLIGGFLHLFATILYVYLGLRAFLAFAYVIDQPINAFDAIKASFQSTRHHICALFLLYITNILIFVVSIIPLGIGLIWSVPYGIICYGVVYKKLGCKNLTQNS